MDEPRPSLALRDAFWLLVLCLVLAGWGRDRGRLATQIDSLTRPLPPAPAQSLPVLSGPLNVSLTAPILVDEAAFVPK